MLGKNLHYAAFGNQPGVWGPWLTPEIILSPRHSSHHGQVWVVGFSDPTRPRLEWWPSRWCLRPLSPLKPCKESGIIPCLLICPCVLLPEALTPLGAEHRVSESFRRQLWTHTCCLCVRKLGAPFKGAATQAAVQGAQASYVGPGLLGADMLRGDLEGQDWSRHFRC